MVVGQQGWKEVFCFPGECLAGDSRSDFKLWRPQGGCSWGLEGVILSVTYANSALIILKYEGAFFP